MVFRNEDIQKYVTNLFNLTWSPFSKGAGNFSSPKANFKLKTCEKLHSS